MNLNNEFGNIAKSAAKVRIIFGNYKNGLKAKLTDKITTIHSAIGNYKFYLQVLPLKPKNGWPITPYYVKIVDFKPLKTLSLLAFKEDLSCAMVLDQNDNCLPIC